MTNMLIGDRIRANEMLEEELEVVIRNLWDLKKNFDRHSAEKIKPLNFNRLLREEAYRNKILDNLRIAKHKTISKLANTLYKQRLAGSVHIDDVRSAKSNNLKITTVLNNAQKTKERNYHEIKVVYKQALKKIVFWKRVAIVAGIALFLSFSLQMQTLIDVMSSNQILIDTVITEDTVWTSNHEYILTKPIFVEGRARLNIESGTIIKGMAGSALIITRNAQIMAKGNAEAPIVFTSNIKPGLRHRGDWGGLVLLGNAPINREQGFIEGVKETDVRGHFGGTNVRDNCGVLEFVRVEFAGFEAFVDNELNGLTLGGCGTDTIVRNVQVHKSLDDGVEIFGGTVDLKNIVITGAGDDAFDWDMGWRGRVQFLIVQMHNDAGDNAFEGDNYVENHNALPRSKPYFYNITLIGGNTKQTAHRAMTIRRGSAGAFNNILVQGFPQEAIDFKGAGIGKLVENNQLEFQALLLNDINDGNYFSNETGENDDDMGFIEADYFSQPHINTRFGIDIRLPSEAYNVYTPQFSPLSHSPARDNYAPIPQGEFWDESATYLGAIRPGTINSWLQKWTAFPSS